MMGMFCLIEDGMTFKYFFKKAWINKWFHLQLNKTSPSFIEEIDDIDI
jgi:hypothetical protein